MEIASLEGSYWVAQQEPRRIKSRATRQEVEGLHELTWLLSGAGLEWGGAGGPVLQSEQSPPAEAETQQGWSDTARAPGDLLTSFVVWGLLATLWHPQHTWANQLWLGPFSPPLAKASGRSIEYSDRPFLLKENASYFQRKGARIFGTPFSICILMATENTQIAPAYSSEI